MSDSELQSTQSIFEKLCPRQPKESAKAYAACRDYCCMGTDRSLDKLHTLYLEKRPQSAPKAPPKNTPSTQESAFEGSHIEEKRPQSGSKAVPTGRLKTLKQWSSKFGWCDRAHRWDGYEMAVEEQQLAETRLEWLPRRIEAQQNRIEKAERLRLVADRLLDIYESAFLSIDLDSPPSPEQLLGLKFLMPERWKLSDIVQMYKLASDLDAQANRSGSDEIAALQILAEAGWVPGQVLDEAADALDEIGSWIKQSLKGGGNG